MTTKIPGDGGEKKKAVRKGGKALSTFNRKELMWEERTTAVSQRERGTLRTTVRLSGELNLNGGGVGTGDEKKTAVPTTDSKFTSSTTHKAVATK